MKFVVHRANQYSGLDSWRQPLPDASQRMAVESVRRELPGEEPDKTILRYEQTELSELELYLLDERNGHTDTLIEDTYHPGKYIGGFVFIHALGIFAHQNSVHHVIERAGSLSPGMIVQEGVKISSRSTLGAFTELERGVQIIDSVVGERSVVRKSAILNGATIAPQAYIGQRLRMFPGVEVGLDYRGGKDVVLEPDVTVGMQNKHGKETVIRRGASLGDSVHIAPYGFVGRNTVIGEMFTAGTNLHVGEGTHIGAESRFGSFVRVAKNLMLWSPTYADDGRFISKSPTSSYQYAPKMAGRLIEFIS